LEKFNFTLGFSKERLQGKGQRVPGEVRSSIASLAALANALASSGADEKTTLLNPMAAAGEGSYSRSSANGDDRYDDFNYSSRSMTEISADVMKNFCPQLEGYAAGPGDMKNLRSWRINLQDEITAARMVPIGTLFRVIVRAVKTRKSAKKQESWTFPEAQRTGHNIIQSGRFQIRGGTWCAHSVAHGIELPEVFARARTVRRREFSLRAYHAASKKQNLNNNHKKK